MRIWDRCCYYKRKHFENDCKTGDQSNERRGDDMRRYNNELIVLYGQMNCEHPASTKINELICII